MAKPNGKGCAVCTYFHNYGAPVAAGIGFSAGLTEKSQAAK